MGKKVEVKFDVKGKEEWFDGMVMSYDGGSGKYGIYFPYDKETIYMSPTDPDIRFTDQ